MITTTTEHLQPNSRLIPRELSCLPVISSSAGQTVDMDRVEIPKKASPQESLSSEKAILALAGSLKSQPNNQTRGFTTIFVIIPKEPTRAPVILVSQVLTSGNKLEHPPPQAELCCIPLHSMLD